VITQTLIGNCRGSIPPFQVEIKLWFLPRGREEISGPVTSRWYVTSLFSIRRLF
jgi:hypothetical protein